METRPTHEQAQLHLKMYELGRDATLRRARDWFFKNYFVDTVEDAIRMAVPGTETGGLLNLVFGYWDQACAFLNYGLLHEDLFFETNREFFVVWERVRAIIHDARKRCVNTQFLAHMEKAAKRYETWLDARSPGHIAELREFTKQMREGLHKPAAA